MDNSGGSGVAQTYYSVNNGPIQTGTSLWLTAGGTYTVQYLSVDNAGNREASHTATYNIDVTGPMVSAMLVENGLTERSYVDQLTFQFNEPVTSTASVPMTLTDFGTQGNLDQPVALTAGQFQWSTAPGTGASVLTWSLESFAGGTSSLPDGYYQLTLPSGQITDAVRRPAGWHGDGSRAEITWQTSSSCKAT